MVSTLFIIKLMTVKEFKFYQKKKEYVTILGFIHFQRPYWSDWLMIQLTLLPSGVIPKYHFIGLNGYLPPEILNSLASLNILTLEFMNLSSKYVVELFMFLGYFTCKGIKIYQLMKIGHSPIFSKTITFSLYKLLPVFP